jgi:hypothetical protein
MSWSSKKPDNKRKLPYSPPWLKLVAPALHSNKYSCQLQGVNTQNWPKPDRSRVTYVIQRCGEQLVSGITAWIGLNQQDSLETETVTKLDTGAV